MTLRRSCYRQLVTESADTAPEPPVLGTEPFTVELANSHYGGTDFLAPRRLRGWLDAVTRFPPGLGREDVADIGDALAGARADVRELFLAAVEGRRPEPGALARVNAAAAAAWSAPALVWPEDGAPRAERVRAPGTPQAVLGLVAAECVELLGEHALAVHRCPGRGCGLFYVKDHPRRRWCHPSCGQRDRQARYQLRKATR